MIRTYSEMILLPGIKERFDYLKLDGRVGVDTFGFERYLNQILYSSGEWHKIRNEVILRDNGCDLADPDYEIHGRIIIHHMNPISKEDIVRRSELVLNPNYLVCVSFDTHNAIHYGDYSLIQKIPEERKPNDTCPWK